MSDWQNLIKATIYTSSKKPHPSYSNEFEKLLNMLLDEKISEEEYKTRKEQMDRKLLQ
tara:strand:- start:2143 stop:2316 length:174 start_codon:yes stop_codon:yes gene_type:complete